jgi:hypothetical protein
MERFKKSGVLFWVLLIVSVALPAWAQTITKKNVFVAKLTRTSTNWATNQGGSGQMLTVSSRSGNVMSFKFDYMVRSFNLGGAAVGDSYEHLVRRVSLTSSDWAGEIVLCDSTNADIDDDCVYDDSDTTLGHGNLDIDGSITQSMLPAGPFMSMAAFYNSVMLEHVQIHFNNPADFSGTFLKQM